MNDSTEMRLKDKVVLLPVPLQELLTPILEMSRRYLSKIEIMYAQTRVTDIRNITVGANLTGSDFLQRKTVIIASLDEEIRNGNMERLEFIRKKRVL